MYTWYTTWNYIHLGIGVIEMKLDNVLLITLISLMLCTGLYIKVLGITNIPMDVEKNGYCKQYGEDWENRRGINICFHTKDKEEPTIIFTEKEFREHCPKHNFLSLKFNSDCFYESGSIV